MSPEDRDDFSFLELITPLVRRCRLVLATALVFAVGTAVLVLLLPPRYTSTTTFVPEAPKESSLSASLGGLANQLAAHMDFTPEHCERVQRFWQSPTIATQPGLKAVDLFEAIGRGDIRAVWIMATNPVVSLPEADRVRAALSRCEFVIVSDCIADTDTTRLAHVLLPAAAWGERFASSA